MDVFTAFFNEGSDVSRGPQNHQQHHQAHRNHRSSAAKFFPHPTIVSVSIAATNRTIPTGES